jgi:colanic acid/amylovoran biosynthesis glycosyltransferase
MKLALITSSAPYGKGESFVITEANALADAGAQVLMVPVVIRPGRQSKPALRPNIKLAVQRLLTAKILKACFKLATLRPVSVLRALWTLRCCYPLTLLKNIAVFPKALWLAEQIRIERVDHIHAHWASTPSTVAMVASMVSGVPWSCTAHRGDIVANNLLCRKLSHAVFVRFISESGIALAAKRCRHAATNVRLLHMGVDIPTLPSARLRQEEYVVLCPANLILVKGHRYLIEAWSRLQTARSAKLMLAGDGELRKTLETQVEKMGLGHAIEFLGQVPHASLLAMYGRGEVDLVVLPSLDLGGGVHEGIPVSLMEAMSYGVPVISTTTGGIPELLNNGAGIMVPHRDSLALAAAIAGLLHDSDIASEQGAQGRARVLQQFNNKITADTLLTWFAKPQV